VRAAADHFTRTLRDNPTISTETRDLLLEHLPIVVEAVLSEDSSPGFEGLSARDAALIRWIVQELRTHTIAEWQRTQPAPSPAEMLAVLGGFERVRSAIDGADNARLASLLASFQGMDLLMELAHDLRSPLTSILFLSDTLHRGASGALSDLQRRQLGLVYSAALGVSALANDVIELVRGRGAGGEEPSRFSIAELFDSVETMLRPMAETRGLELRTYLPTVDRRIGPPLTLSRVLLNLGTNALRCTEKGYVALSARELDRERVEFSVRDSGPGLNAAALQQLALDLRLDGSTAHAGFSGRGLGLTICRKLLTSLGSELRYETAPGAGTTFRFTLTLPPA